MPKGIAIKYTEEMLMFLRQHEETPRTELTCKFNEKFGCNLSADSIKAKCLRMGLKTGRNGCFSPGQKSWNKGLKGYMGANITSFKKGQRGWNAKPIGYERITKDGYIEVKTAEPRTFELKHRVVWKKAHGEIPSGHALVFKNLNKQDCRIENLEIITRGELARLNQSYKHLVTPETNETCVAMAKIKHRVHQFEKGKA
ncbi:MULTISPECIES: HNH endonuclease signature motif containing protein [unclassified Acinetobacter]|uniref:HNH endonuclease signature motif containing protein n=1 Tax=unclassified Acinetobacter TaxID=196816 RepID=UPI0015D3F705|nr:MULTISPECIES: HNH endonuclease signature motif containing protein [unclassified Acinetobacter]